MVRFILAILITLAVYAFALHVNGRANDDSQRIIGYLHSAQNEVRP